MSSQALASAIVDGRRISSDPALEMRYVSGFLGGEEAGLLFRRLLQTVEWRTETVTLFGRPQVVPRRIAWCGNAGVDYRYSGRSHRCEGWMPLLVPLRERLQRELGAVFDFVLLNRYRSGADAMGWHADDEASLGPTPLLASISLGATRRFLVRVKTGAGRSTQIDLEHGSLLVAWGDSQARYQHCIPRTRRPVGERINLTFRTLVAA